MRRILSILLIFALALPSMYQFGVFVDFKLNQDFIAKVLCINKDEPVKKCNGKCYLAKQIEASQPENDQDEPMAGSRVFEEIFFLVEGEQEAEMQITRKEQLSAQYANLYAYYYSFSRFQPPQV